MLPRRRRIQKKLISRVLSSRKVVHSTNFSARFSPHHEEESKVTTIVSKKSAPTAVTRNRIKRKFRGALEPLIGNTRNGFLIVFFPKQSILDVPFRELQREIRKALTHAKIL